MSNINKVPASAGAEWLLAGFALLRRAPVGLGMLGVLWGLLSLLLMFVAVLVPPMLLAMQFLLVLAGPLLFAGMIWAVREVDQGRAPQPSNLLQGLRDGHAQKLLATLLPQVAAGIVLATLLLAMVGTDQLKQLADVWMQMQAIAEAGGQPDPSLVEDLPAGRLLLWLLLVALAFVAVKWMTFVAAPQILFSGTDAWPARRNSLRACAHNWTAMLVFYLLAGVAIFAITLGLLLLSLLAQIIGGATLALLVWQLLLMAVLMPVLAGAMYTAWRQMLAATDASASATAPSQIEA